MHHSLPAAQYDSIYRALTAAHAKHQQPFWTLDFCTKVFEKHAGHPPFRNRDVDIPLLGPAADRASVLLAGAWSPDDNLSSKSFLKDATVQVEPFGQAPPQSGQDQARSEYQMTQVTVGGKVFSISTERYAAQRSRKDSAARKPDLRTHADVDATDPSKMIYHTQCKVARGQQPPAEYCIECVVYLGCQKWHRARTNELLPLLLRIIRTEFSGSKHGAAAGCTTILSLLWSSGRGHSELPSCKAVILLPFINNTCDQVHNFLQELMTDMRAGPHGCR